MLLKCVTNAHAEFMSNIFTRKILFCLLTVNKPSVIEHFVRVLLENHHPFNIWEGWTPGDLWSSVPLVGYRRRKSLDDSRLDSFPVPEERNCVVRHRGTPWRDFVEETSWRGSLPFRVVTVFLGHPEKRLF